MSVSKNDEQVQEKKQKTLVHHGKIPHCQAESICPENGAQIIDGCSLKAIYAGLLTAQHKSTPPLLGSGLKGPTKIMILLSHTF